MMVERWKNFVFLCPSFSHNSRDFCFQRILLLKSHPDNSIWSSSLILPLFSAGGLFWTSKISSINRLILTWQCLNTSLFHLRSASLVLACFLYSLKKADPLVSLFHAFSTMELHPLSLIQAASNRNGLWAKLSSGLVSNRIGVWSNLRAPRWVIVAFGNARRHEILVMALSSLLLIAELPHFPLAHVKVLPEKPRLIALNSKISSFKKLVANDSPCLFLPKISLSFMVKLKSPM